MTAQKNINTAIIIIIVIRLHRSNS